MSVRRDVPSLKRAEKLIGPAATWAGRCYQIASAFVEMQLVRGVAVYGHFLGPVDPESYFGKLRPDVPFIQHGWVRRADGSVVDPTRWSFEARAPYIAVIPKGPTLLAEYDEGGNRWRGAVAGPPPAFDPDDRSYTLTDALLPSAPFAHVEKLLSFDYTEQEPGTISRAQLFYLANLPYAKLQPFVGPIYKAIIALEPGAIPFDNRVRAKREGLLG